MPGESTDTPPITSMIAEGRAYDHNPDLFNPQTDATGGDGNGNQNEPHDVMPDEVPFYASLRTSGANIKIDMQQGYVFSKKPLSVADALQVIVVDVSAAVDVTVTVGDKFWCKVEDDAEGFATAGTVIKGSTWPTDSIAPELIGGDELTGAPGFSHYRLCEVVEEGDFTEVKHWLTGNITHKGPELVNNTINTPYTPEEGARVYKRFYAPTGTHLFRELIAGCGFKITENSDTILFRPSGDTFRVRIWETYLSTDYLGNIEVDAGASPSQEFWVLNGVWHTTEPTTWDDCGGSGALIHELSWVVPTIGGPGA